MSVVTAELWGSGTCSEGSSTCLWPALFQKKPLSRPSTLPYAFLTQTSICSIKNTTKSKFRTIKTGLILKTVLSPWEGLGWRSQPGLSLQGLQTHLVLGICPNDVSARECVMRMELIIHIIHTLVEPITRGKRRLSQVLSQTGGHGDVYWLTLSNFAPSCHRMTALRTLQK